MEEMPSKTTSGNNHFLVGCGLDNSDLTSASDDSSMTDGCSDDSDSLATPLSGRKRNVIDLSEEEDNESVENNVPMTVAAKQKQRRQMRMEIMKRKRQRKDGGNSPQEVFVTPFVPVQQISIETKQEVTDPKLLRKLRNRESAARSRQKLLDLIDSLTCELCDRFVTFQDLQDQYNYLENNSPVVEDVFPHSSMMKSSSGRSQYPSLGDLSVWENDLKESNFEESPEYSSPCPTPVNYFECGSNQQQVLHPSESMSNLMEMLSCPQQENSYCSFEQDYLDYLLM